MDEARHEAYITSLHPEQQRVIAMVALSGCTIKRVEYNRPYPYTTFWVYSPEGKVITHGQDLLEASIRALCYLNGKQTPDIYTTMFQPPTEETKT